MFFDKTFLLYDEFAIFQPSMNQIKGCIFLNFKLGCT